MLTECLVSGSPDTSLNFQGKQMNRNDINRLLNFYHFSQDEYLSLIENCTEEKESKHIAFIINPPYNQRSLPPQSPLEDLILCFHLVNLVNNKKTPVLSKSGVELDQESILRLVLDKTEEIGDILQNEFLKEPLLYERSILSLLNNTVA